jgi:hypothetical protein
MGNRKPISFFLLCQNFNFWTSLLGLETKIIMVVKKATGGIWAAHICAYFAHIFQIFFGKTYQINRLRINFFAPPNFVDPSKDQYFQEKNFKGAFRVLKIISFFLIKNIIIFCNNLFG